MSKKRHKAEEIVAKLRQVEVLTAQGRPVAEAVRAIGVTEVTYYRWRSEYGGLKGDWPDRHFVPDAVRDYCMFGCPSSAGGSAMVTGAGGR